MKLRNRLVKAAVSLTYNADCDEDKRNNYIIYGYLFIGKDRYQVYVKHSILCE